MNSRSTTHYNFLVKACAAALVLLIFINSAYPSNVAILVLFLATFLQIPKLAVGFPIRILPRIIAFVFTILAILIVSVLTNPGPHGSINYDVTLKVIYALTIHVGFIVLFYRNRSLLYIAISIALHILVGFWWLQLIAFYITGEYIDPLMYLGIREQKYAAYFLHELTKFPTLIRPTSLFNEPGTYGSTTLILLAIDYAIKGKIKPVHLATIASFFLALSSFSILAGALFIMIILFRSFGAGHKSFLVFIIMLFFATALVYFTQYYIELRSDKGYGFTGISERLTFFQLWLDSTMTDKLFGKGIMFNHLYIEDNTFLFYLIYCCGLFVIPLFISIAIYNRNLVFISLFLTCLAMKISLTNYAFYVGLSAFLIIASTSKLGPSRRVSR